MDTAHIQVMREVISAERLGPYMAACSGDIRQAMRLYTWNIEVSGAFYGPLQCLEVALRNGMHQRLTVLFGAVDWWSASGARLHPSAVSRIAEAQRKLRARGRPHQPVDVVTELTLGFWVGLLGKGHDYEQRLWRPALHRAFPGYRGPRAPLHRELNNIRLFRNRIMHHEPVHHRHLAADHASVLWNIAYLSAETAACVQRYDRVPAVLARRASVCDGSAVPSF